MLLLIAVVNSSTAVEMKPTPALEQAAVDDDASDTGLIKTKVRSKREYQCILITIWKKWYRSAVECSRVLPTLYNACTVTMDHFRIVIGVS